MGDLDDAIREHLDLKRKHGAAEEEVARKEQEAQRLGVLPSDGHPLEPTEAGADLAEDQPVEPELLGTTEEPAQPSSEALAESDELDVATFGPAEPPPAAALPDELEPDEVLPEEALEPEPVEATPEPPDREPSNWTEDQTNGSRQNDDLLEETPDFLEDMPEQDRLWFEQRSPKDFDFED